MADDLHPSQDTELRERPVGELVKQLSEQTSALLRQELQLAQLELTEKAKRAGIGGGMFGAAGVLGFYAFGALTACFIWALSHAVTGWLAALIVAVAYAAVAGVLALVGRRRLRAATPPIPEQTVDSVKEDVRWTKDRAKAARH
jgi:membrane protein